MKVAAKYLVLGAALIAFGLGAGAAWSQDAMKGQGKAFAAIKAFTEDKGDLAAAQAGGA